MRLRLAMAFRAIPIQTGQSMAAVAQVKDHPMDSASNAVGPRPAMAKDRPVMAMGSHQVTRPHKAAVLSQHYPATTCNLETLPSNNLQFGIVPGPSKRGVPAYMGSAEAEMPEAAVPMQIDVDPADAAAHFNALDLATCTSMTMPWRSSEAVQWGGCCCGGKGRRAMI